LRRLDPDLTVLRIDEAGAAALYGASLGALYVLRPDLHVAGRWRQAAPAEVVASLEACLGHPPKPAGKAAA
jgi:3-(3-hydroxy-phenyl)propionate hydroxylase